VRGETGEEVDWVGHGGDRGWGRKARCMRDLDEIELRRTRTPGRAVETEVVLSITSAAALGCALCVVMNFCKPPGWSSTVFWNG